MTQCTRARHAHGLVRARAGQGNGVVGAGVPDLLEASANDAIGGQNLDPAYVELFRRLVLATAWQESCWRQFINKSGKRWPIRQE